MGILITPDAASLRSNRKRTHELAQNGASRDSAAVLMSDGPSNPPALDPIDSHTPVPDSAATAPPAFGRYHLVKKMGTGSYGEVWCADDLFLGERVALKFLNETFTGQSMALESLKREVRTLRHLSHPNIVRVHDLVFDDRHTAIVMEFIDGRTLAELVQASAKGCLQPEDLEVWMPQLASVFDYLHRSEGIVHSDIKPANLMLTTTGRLKVADFGLAMTLAESTSHMTKTGARPGTIAYMSPQQLRGERPAVADDIYSLGGTLFHLLAGSTPFHGSTLDLISPEKRAPTIGTRRYETGKGKLPPVGEQWESAIAACLSKDARLRPSSVRDVVRWVKPERSKSGIASSSADLGTSVILPPKPAPTAEAKSSGWQPLALASSPPQAAPPPTPAPAPSPSPSSPVPEPAPSQPTAPRFKLDQNTIWLLALAVGAVALIALLIIALVYL